MSHITQDQAITAIAEKLAEEFAEHNDQRDLLGKSEHQLREQMREMISEEDLVQQVVDAMWEEYQALKPDTAYTRFWEQWAESGRSTSDLGEVYFVIDDGARYLVVSEALDGGTVLSEVDFTPRMGRAAIRELVSSHSPGEVFQRICDEHGKTH